MSARPSLSRQITALNGEIHVRRQELDKDVRAGRTTRAQADYVIESLEAIGDTLRWFQRVERIVKQRLFNGDDAPVGGCW